MEERSLLAVLSEEAEELLQLRLGSGLLTFISTWSRGYSIPTDTRAHMYTHTVMSSSCPEIDVIRMVDVTNMSPITML